MADYKRPFDFLNESIGKQVLVYTKSSQISGLLIAFDISINLVLENAFIDGKVKHARFFIKGDSITAISPA